MKNSLVVKGGNVVDVSNRRIIRADLMIRDGIILGIGKVDGSEKTEHVIDATGQYIAPGFIDSHLHIESSLLSPLAFARKAVTFGTTSVFVDPHEIANVCGRQGIRLFLDQSELAPMDIFIGIPSCVPTTDLEDAGASITLRDIKALIHDKRIYGLAEMMNFPGVIHGQGDVRERCDFVYEFGKIVDGHCPGITGEALDMYITNGKMDEIPRITSDHQVATYAEALEKSARGMHVALRYGSAAKDMERVLPDLIKNRNDLAMFILCSDDLNLADLYEKGHMDRCIRRAGEIIMENSELSQKSAAVLAISLATLNPAKYFSKFFRIHNHPEIGEIAVGKRANLVVLSALTDLKVKSVIFAGKVVVENGRYVGGTSDGPDYDYSAFTGSVRTRRTFLPQDFIIKYGGRENLPTVMVIELVKNSILTKKRAIKLRAARGELVAAPEKDIAKIAVIERHGGSGDVSLGFVKGLGLKRGAVASTVSHDSHNLVTVGANDADMARAVNYLVEKGGGMVVANEDGLTGMPLEIGGLMSTKNCEESVKAYKRLHDATKKTGSTLDNTFMSMAFLSLPVIPELRITNRGLVDVDAFRLVELCKNAVWNRLR